MHSSRAKAYFNHAGLSRPGPAVVERMRAAAREYNDFLFSEAGVEMYYAMLAECRRIGLSARWAWGYFLVSLFVAISFAMPLFFAHRHRRLRMQHPEQAALPMERLPISVLT